MSDPTDTPDAAPDAPRLIPLAEIDATALVRDRTGLDASALDELRHSIATTGLRMPVEVFPMGEDSPRFGLISGFRRLEAFRSLHASTGQDRYAAIPAFARAPADEAEALAAMVAENAVRADLSPWEQGMVAVTARDRGVFGNIEAAIDALYPAAADAKRSRLRSLARLAEALDGALKAPEALTLRQALRLAAAVRAGFTPVIRTALEESSATDPASQWQLLLPVLEEAERPDLSPPPGPGRENRPRRILTPRRGLTVRRELIRGGWALNFTGPEATSPLIDTVFDEIELMFGPR